MSSLNGESNPTITRIKTSSNEITFNVRNDVPNAEIEESKMGTTYRLLKAWVETAVLQTGQAFF